MEDTPARIAHPDLQDRRFALRSVISMKGPAQWSAEPAAIVISRHLTPQAAEAAIDAAEPCLVMTTFDAAIFAAGGSSLRILRDLVERGHTVRAVSNLQSKVLFAKDQVFIGSLDLVTGGETEIETVLRIDAACDLYEVVLSWAADSPTITLAMIDEMEQGLGPLEKLAAELREKAEALNEEVRRRERERLERSLEDLKQEEVIEAAQNAYDGLRRAVAATPAARTRVFLTLRELWTGEHSYWTLTASSGRDMTELAFEDTDYNFETRNRYLLIVPKTGRLGWPAMNRTRFTRFGTKLDPSHVHVQLPGRQCRVSIEFNRAVTTLPEWNVKFRLYRNYSNVGLDIKARFTLEGFDIAEVTEDPSGWISRQEILDHVCDPDSDLTNSLRSSILEPFKYRENSYGESAEIFCAGLGELFTLRWRLFQEYPFFTLEQRY